MLTQTRSPFSRIFRGSLWSVTGAGAGRVMYLAAMVLAARFIGVEGFGLFGLVQSTLGLFALFAGAALGATATRHIASHRQSDPHLTGRVISLVVTTALISGCCFAAIILLTSDAIARSILDVPNLSYALRVGAAMVAVGVLRGVSDAVLAGFERFDRIAAGRVIEGAVALAAIPIMVSSFGLTGGIAGLTLGGLFALVLTAGFARKEIKRAGISLSKAGIWQEWRVLRDFSLPSLIAGTVATPVLWFAMLLLSRENSGLQELGIYNASLQWYSPIVFVPMALASVSLPILSKEWSEGNCGAFRQTFVKTSIFAGGLTILAAIVISLGSAKIEKLYGGDFTGMASVIFLLLLSAPFHVICVISTAAIQTLNLSWFLPLTNTIWGIILISLFDLFGKAYGAHGLAASLFSAYVILAISNFTLVLWYSGTFQLQKSC